MGAGGVYGNSLYFFLKFCCEPKTVFKKKERKEKENLVAAHSIFKANFILNNQKSVNLSYFWKLYGKLFYTYILIINIIGYRYNL